MIGVQAALQGGRPRRRRWMTWATAALLAFALALPAAAQKKDQPIKLHKQAPVSHSAGHKGIPKPRLPEQSPFLSSPAPAASGDDQPDLAIGEGVNLTGHFGTTSDSAAPSEPSALKTKRTALVPRQDTDFALGKHALTDGVSLGISLDLPSLGGSD